MREALAKVDPAGKSASHSDSSANPLDRLARGVFVGRERELERLRDAFDQAFAGHGSVLMLVGEPGIGKTRTTQELETYARMRGAQVLWGRAHESAGAPPYWPWVYVARAYRDQNAEEVRRREWEPYAVELQRIFAGLHALFPNLPPPPEVESEETQFALFDAMAGFLHSVSLRVPLVIVLDDLHWADRATLQMLAHIARDLLRSRILVLGTYRDTDLDRRHPLSQALGQMNREDLFSRIPLRGLTRDEVGAYIAQTAGITPAQSPVQRIYEETEGNPFFLSQVVQLMTQEGTLTSQSLSDVAIPEGVREALGRRLDRLSEEANSLLAMLAVVGRDCDHDLAKELSGHDDETLLGLLEEAIKARVLEETGPTSYRFTHALMQETLLEEVTAARRVRLHARIGEALERRYGEAPETLAQIASHYCDAEPIVGAEKGVRFSLLAGQQALASAAWEEAEHHFRRGLELSGDRADTTIAQLLHGSARARLAQNASFQTVPAIWRDLQRAFDMFDSAGDAEGMIAVADHEIPASRPIDGLSAMSARALQLVQLGSREAARLHARHGYDVGTYDRDFDSGSAELEQARSMAADLGDDALQTRVLGYMASLAGLYMRWDECIAISREALGFPAELLGTNNFYFATVASQALGEAGTTSTLVDAMIAAAARSRVPQQYLAARHRQALSALVIGDWASVRAADDAMFEYAPQHPTALSSAAMLQAELGRFDAACALLADVARQQPAVPATDLFAISFAVCAMRGAIEPHAVAYVATAMPKLMDGAGCAPLQAFGAQVALAMLAISRGDKKAARAEYDHLSSRASTFYWVSVDRILGLIDEMFEDSAQAARHFEDAIAFCRRAGYRPELARALHDLGKLLVNVATGDAESHARGRALLDEALGLANELEMGPLVDQVLSTRGVLRA